METGTQVNLHDGDRIQLLEMPDDPQPIPAGSLGIVRSVQAIGVSWTQVDVDWDDGRRLLLSIPPDRVQIMTTKGAPK